MKSFKFTKQTGQVALVFFTLYFTYGLFYIPFTQFLVSLAVGAIVYGIMDSYELATISLLATNFVFSMLVRTSRNEGFVGEQGTQSGTQKDPKEKESTGLTSTGVMPGGSLQGVGSQMSEGFADASETDMSISEAKTSTESEVSVAKSKPASADSTDAVDGKDLEKMASMMKKMMAMNPDVLSSSKATKISEDNVPANEPQEVVKEKAKKESFQDNSGLFKLGQIPKDEKGGHHIDAGTTVMNAISALKPDQIKAMTMDTKQLIETQKSLMGMLQTFQPMVSEGKQMMETFQEMFSPAMGSLNAASKAVGN